MIGVLARDSQKNVVEEFFELFKTPWEFFDPSREYEVLIVTDASVETPMATLTIVFSRLPVAGIAYDSFSTHDAISVVRDDAVSLPIYRGLATFRTGFKGLLHDEETGMQVSAELPVNGGRVLHIGYDIFDEVKHLLSAGQPVGFAQIPTVERHIALLRNWILESGITLIEIPPVPHGYGYIACLTHDVDFIGIRDHLFDRSILGFLYRSLSPVYCRGLSFTAAFRRYQKNLKAVLSLPAVLFGLARDFWFDIDRFMQIENGIPATYFFIPFKDHPGDAGEINSPGYRAAKYDLNEHRDLVHTLLENGNEVGLHGIDAWHESREAAMEKDVVRGVAGKECAGIRMHWLYFSEDSPAAIQDAGLKYDSSLGYNETIGFKCGTSQAFKIPGSDLYELPLNIMDTALFTQGRLALSEDAGLRLCERMLGEFSVYGGVLTVNWHTRSLSPERNWDEFYEQLLQMIKTEKPWFASGEQAVDWFDMRRSVRFDGKAVDGRKVRLSLTSNINSDLLPPMTLRAYSPTSRSRAGSDEKGRAWDCTDQPIIGANSEVEL